MPSRHTFSCIDAHTCGNPVRVVSGGVPFLKGKNMLEKRQYFLDHLDWIRTGLMFEPRGHDMMSGSMLFPPHDPENDFAVLFIETSGCLPMCGHGTIGTITIAIEEGLIHPKTPGFLRMEAPAGLVLVEYRQEGKKVKSVKLTNVKSYLAAENLDIEIEDKGLSHVLWTGKPLDPNSTARNAVFYGDKAIDRSPCGTGTSARMAQWYAKGWLKPGEEFVHESFIGSKFIGRIEEVSTLGGKPAIVPSIEGWAKVYGYNTIILDEDDPYVHGFQVI